MNPSPLLLHASWPLGLSIPVPQATPWDDAPARAAPPPAPPSRQLSLSGFKQGLHDFNTGKTNDNSFRNGILALLAVAVVVVWIVHFRRHREKAGPPDSMGRLGRELGRQIGFPFGSRLALKWVARSSKMPFASLLLSTALFDKCVQEWVRQPTFSVVRQWGKGRLERLRPVLFGPAAKATA